MEYLWLLLIPLGFVLYFLYSSLWGRPISVRILFDRYFIRLVLQNPELLSTIGIPLREGKLTDLSTQYSRKQLLRAKKDLNYLRSYKKERMKLKTRLSVLIMEWFLDDIVKGEKYLLHGYPVNQMFGVQSELPDFMATIHRVANFTGARNYIKRLNRFEHAFCQLIAGLKEREELGIIPPRFVQEQVISQMESFISSDVTKNLLYTSFDEKLKKTKISKKTCGKLLLRCDLAIKNSVFPAYRKLIDYCRQLLAKSTLEDGVWKLPDGIGYYQYQLRSHTTTDKTPEEVHVTGLNEVSRIEGEMTNILIKQGYKNPEAVSLLSQFTLEKRFLFPNTDEGRQDALKQFEEILEHINSNLTNLFNKRPKAALKVERVPEFKEKTSADAYYMIPSLDGKRPGVFYANLRNMADIPKFGMRTLAYHEGIPGHHFQLALAQEIKKVPIFRKVIPFTAYAEGWALYAEKLARENEFLKDPYDELGYLQSELIRAVRLVVDTGLHSKRWTREQAIEYMIKHTGSPEASVISEIERYIVMPGQACAYKIGELKIVELRQKAMNMLGKAFDIREFHDVILQNGAMPLEILEGLVNEYIEQKVKVVG